MVSGIFKDTKSRKKKKNKIKKNKKMLVFYINYICFIHLCFNEKYVICFNGFAFIRVSVKSILFSLLKKKEKKIIMELINCYSISALYYAN